MGDVIHFANRNLTEAEWGRFQSKVDVAPSGCWLWNGPLDKDGYGTFYLRRRGRRAHRVGWFLLNGPIPEQMVVNHVCKQRSCVNPQHLQIVTPRENSLRDSQSPAAVNARKTHCPKGHPYDRVHGSGGGKKQRVCSECQRDKQRRLRQRWIAEDDLAV